MKLLIVEDEEDIRQALCRGLKKKGYGVDEAGDGQEALALHEINQYDLIILDLNLPLIDGMGVLQTIRAKDTQTKVLILSAKWAVEDKVEGLDLGANDYVVKPFHFAELEARIRSLLRRQFNQQQSVLVYGPLAVDTTSRTAQIKGQPLELTSKEFAILEYLLLHKGQTISAEQLIEHIWDSETDLFSNAIKVHISTLRKKIAMYWDYEVIKNIRGAGYLIEETKNELLFE